MKKRLKRFAALMCAALALLTAGPVSASASSSYSAPVSIVRIGLYTLKADGSADVKTFPSANLQNVQGCGNGYEFGYYNSDRQYISLGAQFTDVTKISMLMDRNMVYSSSGNTYTEGTSGSVVVGCFHVRVNGSYPDYSTARAAADTFTSVNAFVRYENGSFYVMAGDYTSADEASAAAGGLGIAEGYTIDSGTSYTVAVVETGTDRLLFEFDCGSQYSLAVHPLSVNGEKTKTYFKNNMYYGDFVYWRNTGGNLTVINYLNVEDYIKGVIPYEMNNAWPVEALKAQAVSARTYVMYNINKHKLLGFDVCNATDCQAYRGTGGANATTDSVVDATAGQYLTYQGKLCDIYYYSSNGGASENVENVWTAKYAYLRGVRDPYEAKVAGSVSSYNWSVSYTGSTLASKLQSKGCNCSTITRVDLVFTEMGNVYSISFTDSNGRKFTFSKEKARTILSLRSQRYTVNGQGQPAGDSIYVNTSGGTLDGEISDAYAIGSGGTSKLPSGDVYAISGKGTVSQVEGGGSASTGGGPDASGRFVITGSGYGHNVGMSQWGAYSMAKYYNMTYIDILTFYYTGAQVVASA